MPTPGDGGECGRLYEGGIVATQAGQGKEERRSLIQPPWQY
jgi:hypothetical protein